MISGRDTLGSLDRALADARREFQHVDSELQGSTSELAKLQREESRLYSELARLRMHQLDSGSVLPDLDAADQRAGVLLQQRTRRVRELGASLASVNRHLLELEAERDRRAADVDAARQALDNLEQSVQKSLAADARYRERVKSTQRAVDTAAAVEEKTRIAEQDRREKGRPYEQDSLFAYLWQCGYGTSGYRGGPIARFIDGVIARHIGYETARRNYYLLNEIPLRLRQYLERLEAQARRHLESLADFERQAEHAAGAESLEAALEAVEHALAATDTAILQAEEKSSALLREREQYASGSDSFLSEAVQVLVSQFRREPLRQLRFEAESTAERSDDDLIGRLAEARNERHTLEQRLEDRRDLHTRRLNRLNELEHIRRRFKHSGFDSTDSIFDDAGKFELMLGEFLRGMISSERLWRIIRHSQRFRRRRRRPAAGGTGGLPRIPRSISLPRGRSGSGGLKIPRMPRGGGFRTKGGF